MNVQLSYICNWLFEILICSRLDSSIYFHTNSRVFFVKIFLTQDDYCLMLIYQITNILNYYNKIIKILNL